MWRIASPALHRSLISVSGPEPPGTTDLVHAGREPAADGTLNARLLQPEGFTRALWLFYAVCMPTPLPENDAKQVFNKVSIPIAYKMGYITNNYREPSFRAIEIEYGLTRPETLTLIFLGASDGSTASEICEHSGHLKTNISRAVVALENKGLITRTPSPEDMRRYHLHMTTEGWSLHDKFIRKLFEREQAMMSCLTHAEYVMFDALLEKVCAHVPSWSDKD